CRLPRISAKRPITRTDASAAKVIEQLRLALVCFLANWRSRTGWRTPACCGVGHLHLPLRPPACRTGRQFALLRSGRRGGGLLQLLIDVDGIAALRVEHDVERLHPLVLLSKGGRGRTFAK